MLKSSYIVFCFSPFCPVDSWEEVFLKTQRLRTETQRLVCVCVCGANKRLVKSAVNSSLLHSSSDFFSKDLVGKCAHAEVEHESSLQSPSLKTMPNVLMVFVLLCLEASAPCIISFRSYSLNGMTSSLWAVRFTALSSAPSTEAAATRPLNPELFLITATY